MIFPKALRFVKRKGSFSQRERLAWCVLLPDGSNPKGEVCLPYKRACLLACRSGHERETFVGRSDQL
jgi:hypothetical protein